MIAIDSTTEGETVTLPWALGSHRIYEGADPEGAHLAVSGTIDPHELRVTGHEPILQTRLYGASVGAVTLCYLHYGADVEISALELADCLCLHFPLGGAADVRCGSERIVASPSLAAVPNPFDPLRMKWSAEAAHLIIRVDREALEGQLRSYIGSAGNQPIRTELGLRLDGSSGRRWRSIIQLLETEIDLGEGRRAGAPMAEARAAAIQDVVLNSLLLAHPNNLWPLLSRHQAPARAPYVRRAIEFIQENLAMPITTALLSKVTGVSGRSLQVGFARDLGCTPSAYIRDQRLARAHAELAAAELDQGVTVTDVALRSGFSHLGRFSRVYRSRYGELPSATLRRPPAVSKGR